MSPDRKTPAPANRQRDLFLAALEFSNPAERADFLASACGADRHLRQGVEEMLAEQEQLGSFLDTPVLGDARPRRQVGEGSSSRSAAARPGSEKIGDRIGRYKLLQEIGEGGCGVVFMADQEEPVRRRVALKVIKAGMDTRSVIARFEAERQALALMDHPNIAKVLEAGTTESGRPYFVMELVRGIRITEHCDQNNLTTRERLDLFIKVCHAIQHAHQKGIIHRDIKASNILVTLHDGVPVPKVIDFGIAKAIEQRLTDKTVFTAFEQFLGTPAYMSPEQAEMSGLDIDTRTDIYSLGVLLYEILTGKTPFDGKELVSSGLDAMRRTIREKEPVRPSTRLQTLEMAEAADLVKSRQERLPALVKMIRGDLDWIVMKAVAKDRTRRYETANGFALDIQRYLNGETISARPPSRTYRIQKFVQRNKILVGAGAGMLIVLVLAAVVSSWQAIRATRAERERTYLLRAAEAARQREVRQRQRAETERLAALRRAYNSDMNLVPQALLANNYGRVIDLLNRHRRKATPAGREAKSDVEPDFRQWEWRYFWNQAQSDAAFALPRQANTITTLVLSPDGRFLASGDRSGTLKLWDLFRRAEVVTLREGGAGGGFGGSPFAFSPNGERLAIALNEHPRRSVVKLWATGPREVTQEVVIDTGLQALAFGTNSARLFLFGEDGAVRAWDLGAEEPVLRTAARDRGSRFSRSFGATFSPDAKSIAFAEAGRIRVIDTENGIEKCSMAALKGLLRWRSLPTTP
ncbi:MAG: serine/threonine-protein kinase [Verrucomicrobiales bacterium]|nr:serine/threonine-protein kinase [Verrucomicrobiales bacterium]